MIQIRESIPDDVFGIRNIQRVTWINTYPNESAGISKKDIEDKFAGDDTQEGIARIEAKKLRYGNNNLQTWVATDDQKIIGFCVAGIDGEKHQISALYVLPEYQGKGIDYQLISKGIEWLGKDKKIFVNVVEYNQPSIDFYQKVGFVPTGVKGVFDSAATLPSGKYMAEIELTLQT